MIDPEEQRLSARVAELYRRPVPLEPGARARLDEALRKFPPPNASRFDGWRSPFRFGSRPVLAASALALAAIVAGFLVMRPPSATIEDGRVTTPPATDDHEVVHFVLVAPGASSVVVVGDFNGWDQRTHPMQKAPDGGTWSVAVPISAGPHAYAYVIDGDRWMADPVAPLAPEDAFGFRNSVVVVGGDGGT